MKLLILDHPRTSVGVAKIRLPKRGYVLTVYGTAAVLVVGANYLSWKTEEIICKCVLFVTLSFVLKHWPKTWLLNFEVAEFIDSKFTFVCVWGWNLVSW